MRKEDNREKYKEYDHRYYIKHRRPNSKIGKLETKISDLEAKLVEMEKKYAELFSRNIELETLYSQKTALLNFYKDTDLVKENQQLKEQLETFAHRISDQNEEILDINQQLHDLPKKIVEEIEKNFTEYLPLKYKTGAGFYSRLNAILKKYGGEDE